MCCQGFIKRIVPFFLTFAAGLFIASFFVTVAAPNLQFRNRGWRGNHRQYDRQREAEIQRLREENQRLKNALQENVGNFSATVKMKKDGSVGDIERMEINGVRMDALVPPPPPPAPPAPPTLRSETIPYRGR